ncbi:helix-turn-helix domain-containing protein [Eleftheria terrae]|uniref:helix-turn-helix domain-containing protein n=1 Tax=Eleftheria terrae TaxID=1597781 RepID=UPI00263B7381|nr:helix-turn-helix domain-containing protein [Eleftheria terrae]WKB52294.1 helix-turn-helix domain-containing protein [Eleftheria terrae]
MLNHGSYHVRDCASITKVMQLAGVITHVNTIADRLKEARERKGWSQQKLADVARVSQSTIGNIEAGLRRVPRELLAIAEALDVSPRWLKDGTPEEPTPATMEPAPLPMYRLRNVRPVWVVGQTQGGLPERIWTDGDYPVGATDEYAEVATTDPNAFIVRITGDSMIPRYMPREFALVEPNVAPELEDDVLVRLASGETMLKRLLGRRGGIRLGSYNAPEIYSFHESEVSWLYYVAHPIPARKIRHYVALPEYTGPDRRVVDAPVAQDRRSTGRVFQYEGGHEGELMPAPPGYTRAKGGTP